MIRRGLVALLVGSLCFGVSAEAADIPFSVLAKPVKSAKVPRLSKKKASPAIKVVVAKPVRKPAKPVEVVAPEVPDAGQPPAELQVATPAPEPAPEQPKGSEVQSGNLELAWFLDPLVANADGPKGEGSSSIEGNLIVVEPGYASSPHMEIELTGHIIKTPDTTVRVDVQVGSAYRSVTWTNEDVKSGRFSVTLKAPMKAGKLPGYFPVSALAFVTRKGKQGAAMVSVEKVTVRLGKVSEVAVQ